MVCIKKLLTFLILSFMLINTAGAMEKTDEKKVTYLFIEVASGGTLQKDKNSNELLLTLKGVEPHVTYFSNVPVREAGFMSLQDFNKSMNEEIKSHPAGLNSGLIALDDKDKTLKYALSLRDPRYDAENKTITFLAKFIPGSKKLTLSDSVNFQHVALFIDDVCASCGGSGF